MNTKIHNGHNSNGRNLNREQRLEIMRQRKKRQQLIRKLEFYGLIILGLILCICFIVFIISKVSGTNKVEKDTNETIISIEQESDEIKETVEENEDSKRVLFVPVENDSTKMISSEINSQNAILVDYNNSIISAKKNAEDIINPASMTKVLTILVAAKHIENLDDTFTITQEIADYCYKNDCSTAGFDVGETVSVKDLFYGAILPSGGEAALSLATYVSGSQDAFVEMMNEEIKELGISDTAHFTNCIGIYDKNHYCTVYDLAIIMKAVIDNEFCKEVLSTHTYTTCKTKEHPDGIIISNWFLRRIEDKDSGGEVLGGKTGYVVQSKNCAVSFAKGNDGKEFICVTAGANSGWRCIYDHVTLYKEFF